MNIEECRIKLKKYNQEHLLNFYESLEKDQRESLINQIENIDLELIKELYNNVLGENSIKEEIIPIKGIDANKLEELSKYIKTGEELIRDGKLAVCQMAGGQGTRLGHTGPKGTYMLGLEKPKSIFEIFSDEVKEKSQKYNTKINWYIMTSETNHEETVDFFKKNNYFEYDPNYIKFFKQGELPIIDKNGKIILKTKSEIYKAADGNGGIFLALSKNNILNEMKEKNIEYLAIGNVDNILINMIDPLMIGLMEINKKEIGGKATVKEEASEKSGVFVKINKKPGVIEYTEITEEMSNAKKDGEYIYSDSHMGCNFFKRELLEKIANKKLPYHTAIKKNNYIDEKGNEIIATEPNTYKFEMFIFDAFPYAEDIEVLRVNKNEEFAPVKNKEGENSPKTAIQLYKKFHKLN